MTDTQSTSPDDIAAVERCKTAYDKIRAELAKVIVGQKAVVRHVLIGLIAGGHILLEGVPGLGDHRPKQENTTKGGWYAAHGLYHRSELEGLSITRFCQAVSAEGARCSPGCNKALHMHPLFNTLDV